MTVTTTPFNVMPNWPALCRYIGENIASAASTPKRRQALVACLVLPGDGGFWALTNNDNAKNTLWCKNEYGESVKWTSGPNALAAYDARVSEAVAFVRCNAGTWDEWESTELHEARTQADAENAAKLAGKEG